MSEGRNQRKVYQGRVVSDKMEKTITVVVETYLHVTSHSNTSSFDLTVCDPM